MDSNPIWKDVTSYSRSQIERKPTCFELSLTSGMRLVLVWNHRYCPDVWSVSLYGTFEHHELKASYPDAFKEAKLEALQYTKKRLNNALDTISKAVTLETQREEGFHGQ